MVRFAKANCFRAVVCAVAVFACAGAVRADVTLLKHGKEIAQHNCGRCHAVGVTGKSANPKSPPFRKLARKYPLSNLEEALAEGIVVGHEGPEMPQFQFSTDQIAALLGYLRSIQR